MRRSQELGGAARRSTGCPQATGCPQELPLDPHKPDGVSFALHGSTRAQRWKACLIIESAIDCLARSNDGALSASDAESKTNRIALEESQRPPFGSE